MSNKAIIFSSIAVAVGLVAIAAFSGGGEGRPRGTSSLHNQIRGGGSADANQQAPNFTLTTLDGSTVSLADFQGKKAVVLNFWASWCPNCRRDMPKLSGFYQKYKDQVEVIGVNLQESKSTVERYITSARISFPIVLDPGSSVARNYGIRYTNTHILISKEGKIVSVIPGDIREADIKSLIEI